LTKILIEAKCPTHGLERFKIKIIKKYNVKADTIAPIFRTKPKAGELSCLIIGRNIKYNDVKDYLITYLHETGLIDSIITMKIIR
jgi:hypothetical protein